VCTVTAGSISNRSRPPPLPIAAANGSINGSTLLTATGASGNPAVASNEVESQAPRSDE
jgi:hypothetical protein